MGILRLIIKLLALIIAISLSLISWAYMYNGYSQVMSTNSYSEEEKIDDETKKDISKSIVNEMSKLFKLDESWNTGESFFFASLLWSCISIFL